MASFTLLSLSSFIEEEDEPQWLIKDILPTQAIALLVGEDGAFKTFSAICMGGAVSTLPDFMGHVVQSPGDVVYLIGEGGVRVKRRFRAWTEHYGVCPERFFVLNQRAQVVDGELADVADEIKARGVNPKLIIIDTLARNFGNGDESKTLDMNKFVMACDQLREQFTDCTILIVHHVGWAELSRPRGARSLPAAADTIILCERKPKLGVKTRLTVKKQRDGEELREPVKLRLKTLSAEKAVIVLDDEAEGAEGTNADIEELLLTAIRAAGPAGMRRKDMDDLAPHTSIHRALGKLFERGEVGKKGRRGLWFAREHLGGRGK